MCPRGCRDGVGHARRVLEQELEIAARLSPARLARHRLLHQRGELRDDRRRDPRVVLVLDTAVLEGVHEVRDGGRPARVVDAVRRRRGEVVARRRGVGLVDDLALGVLAALRRERPGRAARGRGLGLKRGVQLGLARRRLVRCLAPAAGGDRDHDGRDRRAGQPAADEKARPALARGGCGGRLLRLQPFAAPALLFLLAARHRREAWRPRAVTRRTTRRSRRRRARRELREREGSSGLARR